jgi:hypothetical protein
MSTAAFTLSNSTTAEASWTPTASQCTLQSCFVLPSTLTVVACGLVLILFPSLVVTLLAQLRIQVSTASTTYEHSVPAVRSRYDSQEAIATCHTPTTPRRKYVESKAITKPTEVRHLMRSNELSVTVGKEVVYSSNNRDPMSTPKVRSLQASVHGFYSDVGFFKFAGSGTYLIRHPLLRRFKFKYSPAHGYILRVPEHIQLAFRTGVHRVVLSNYRHGALHQILRKAPPTKAPNSAFVAVLKMVPLWQFVGRFGRLRPSPAPVTPPPSPGHQFCHFHACSSIRIASNAADGAHVAVSSPLGTALWWCLNRCLSQI